jgi:hypothetical protein
MTCRIPGLVLVKCELNVLDHQHRQILNKKRMFNITKNGLKMRRIITG